MDVGCGGSAGASGGGPNDSGSEGGDGLKRKWSELESFVKKKKYEHEVARENAQKTAKIRRLMEQNARLEHNVFQLENSSTFQGPSGTGQTPLPDPFVVFPQLVWEWIITRMQQAADLEMLCVAFPQLEPLVKKIKKTIFMFEKVIPLVSKLLNGRDIQNCRLVCEKWNRDLCAIVVNSNASASNLLLSSPTSSFTYSGPSFLRAYSFDTTWKIQTFLNKMADHPGNPFFGRSVCFSVFNKTDFDNFFKSALQLVEKFGEHVWCLDLSYNREFYNLIEFYKALQQLLIHLPRALKLNCFISGRVTSATSMKIAAQFGSSPLPPLPYLQSFKLAHNGKTGMINAFTPYFSNQIRRLELLEETLGNVNLKDESLRGLINLQHLEVELKSKEDVLRLLKFPTANLKTLYLHASHYPTPLDPDSFTMEEYASLSEKFSRLEHLNLVGCQRELSSFLCSRIQFSGVKTLEITVEIREDDILDNLDFLLWFSSLKHLVILIWFMGGNDIVEYDKHSALKIENYLYEGEMLESNVWTLIPSLELLETRGKFFTFHGIFPKGNGIFTREMFENRVG